MNEIVEAKSATFEPWGLKEECGVFGVWGCPDEALPYVILGLHALQHRGQEGVGIVTNDKGDFSAQLDAGLVSDVFPLTGLSQEVCPEPLELATIATPHQVLVIWPICSPFCSGPNAAHSHLLIMET